MTITIHDQDPPKKLFMFTYEKIWKLLEYNGTTEAYSFVELLSEEAAHAKLEELKAKKEDSDLGKKKTWSF